jgi:hypothetical protein
MRVASPVVSNTSSWRNVLSAGQNLPYLIFTEPDLNILVAETDVAIPLLDKILRELHQHPISLRLFPCLPPTTRASK